MEPDKKLRILMLEDNENDAFLCERVLRKGNINFSTERVDTRDEFVEAVGRFKPDVILSDHGLPQFNSREALKIAMRERPMAPFILVTGTMSDENAIACLQEGADDYILKGNLSRLPIAIERAIKERRLAKLKREARHALRQQNKELAKVNAELDNFVYSVSHNLRGPLASIIGLLHAVDEEPDALRIDQMHNMMLKNALRLDQTLKEILDYSQNARSEIRHELVNWADIIDRSREKLQAYSNAEKIRFTINYPESSLAFHSDPARLQLLCNALYTNAFQYADPAREMFVETTIAVGVNGAMISIADNGIGISEEVLPKVFDMFYRGTTASQGAGLGLYIAREVVRRLGGHIEIRSVEGEGTTVEISLPSLTQDEL